MKYTPTKQTRYAKFLKEIKDEKNQPLIEKVLLIDGLNLFIRSFAAVPVINSDGFHTGGLYGSLNSIKYAVKVMNPTRTIIVFDGRGGAVRRRKIYSEYKAGRRGLKGLNKTFNWESEEQEQQSCVKQLHRFLEYLKRLPVTVLSVDNIEADDGIAYITQTVLPDKKKIIMSTDKDFYQLVSNNTTIWSPTKKKVYNVKAILEEFEVHPNNFLLYRIVDGDSSDNIPGIKGIGRKTMLKYFPDMLNVSEVHTVDSLVEYAKSNIDINNRYKTIYDNSDVLFRNYKLMQLYDVDISGEIKSIISDVVLKQKISIMNSYELKKMLMEDKLYFLIKSFASWYAAYQQMNSYAIGYNKNKK